MGDFDAAFELLMENEGGFVDDPDDPGGRTNWGITEGFLRAIGDRRFWRQDAVERCWAYFSPLIEECETCAFLERLIHPYTAGTWGPKEAGRLLRELWP